LTQAAANATADELGWLAHYLADLPAKDAVALAHELESGKATIATLQAPPVVAAVAGGSDSSNTTEQSLPSTEAAQPSANPASSEATGPETVAAWWEPWANNGVAVAAGVVVLLLVAFGMVMALRRDLTDPPL
jgi:hypothetical protein